MSVATGAKFVTSAASARVLETTSRLWSGIEARTPPINCAPMHANSTAAATVANGGTGDDRPHR